jgi:hypothetical protein
MIDTRAMDRIASCELTDCGDGVLVDNNPA